MKVAMVTGAGSGIGKHTALALVRARYAVALAGRRRASLEATAQEASDGDILVVPTDVTDPDAVRALFAETKQAFGRLDLLFNNAGQNAPGIPLEDLEVDQWRAVVDVNLTGSFLCLREAFRVMKRQRPMGGRIINNGSIAAHVPRPNSVHYTATKHAITGLTRSLSLDGRELGIACGQIDIGNARTPMVQGLVDAAIAEGNEPDPTMAVADAAKSVLHMANLPAEANVQFMTVMATTMPYIGRG